MIQEYYIDFYLSWFFINNSKKNNIKKVNNQVTNIGAFK